MQFISTNSKGLTVFFLRSIVLLASITLSAVSMADPDVSTPAANSTLSGTTQVFSWTDDGVDVDQWWLYIGTTQGSFDIANSGNLGVSTEFIVNRIPVDGSTIHARLWYNSESRWQFTDTTYTASEISNAGPPSLSSPENGSVLSGSSIEFEWRDNNTSVSHWWLTAGSRQGSDDIYNSGRAVSNANSVTINNLPVDGSTIHVRLWYFFAESGWRFIDNTYIADDDDVVVEPDVEGEGVIPYTSLSTLVDDPIPQAITAGGVSVQTEVVATIPQSVENPEDNSDQLARVNYGYHAKDGSNRLFINDLNGKISVITPDGEALDYLDVADSFELRIDGSLNAGLSSFTFHPDFANNGLLYTIHTEVASGSSNFDFDHPNSDPDNPNDRTHSVVTEWTTDNTSANVFTGSSREVLRTVHVTPKHGIQLIEFNRAANENSDDQGYMYLSIGDGEDIAYTSTVSQELEHPQGKILRIIPDINDERGTLSQSGNYRIPDDNPFVGSTEGALHEIYAYGFRNPIRFDFDPANGNMLVTNTGEKNLEEVELIVPGGNYGWPHREGTFARFVNDRDDVYEVPEANPNLLDPVAQYDHDEGFAIIGGFVYRGDAIPQLSGSFVFGDIVKGGVFYVDADVLTLGEQATVRALTLLDDAGNEVDFLELVGGQRADIRFALDATGEMYLMSKQDGVVRRLINPAN